MYILCYTSSRSSMACYSVTNLRSLCSGSRTLKAIFLIFFYKNSSEHTLLKTSHFFSGGRGKLLVECAISVNLINIIFPGLKALTLIFLVSMTFPVTSEKEYENFIFF